MFGRAYKTKWFWDFWVELDLSCSFGIYRVLRILRILKAVGKTLRTIISYLY